MTTAIPAHREAHPVGPLRGRLRVPGDKSVSHRALIFGGLSGGKVKVRGLLESGDVHATRDAMRACGVRIDAPGDGTATVYGLPELAEPSDVIDCGNSGTSMRLLCGVFAARAGHAVLTGDASLRRRPMARVAVPLRAMGASVDGREGGRLAPLAIRGGDLQAVDHELMVASAQVKSCLLLAGLAHGVRVREPRQSRDHSERLFRAMGADLRVEEGWLDLRPSRLSPIDIDVPGDVSSAAFLFVAATLIPGSDVVLSGVGMNPTRTGVVDALLAMGANIEVEPESDDGVEPRATLRVRHAPLRGIHIDGDLALRSLDELPVLAVAAAFAVGETIIADARELRVKESDRIARVVASLRALGAEVEERADGMVLAGGGMPGGGQVDASGDHRIAMAFTVAGMACAGGCRVLAADAVASSWPGFYSALATLSQSTES